MERIKRQQSKIKPYANRSLFQEHNQKIKKITS